MWMWLCLVVYLVGRALACVWAVDELWTRLGFGLIAIQLQGKTLGTLCVPGFCVWTDLHLADSRVGSAVWGLCRSMDVDTGVIDPT